MSGPTAARWLAGTAAIAAVLLVAAALVLGAGGSVRVLMVGAIAGAAAGILGGRAVLAMRRPQPEASSRSRASTSASP